MTSGAVGTPPHSLPLVTISPKKQLPFSNFGVSEAGWIRGVSVWHLSVSSFRLFTVQPNFLASSTALVDNLWHKFAVSPAKFCGLTHWESWTPLTKQIETLKFWVHSSTFGETGASSAYVFTIIPGNVSLPPLHAGKRWTAKSLAGRLVCKHGLESANEHLRRLADGRECEELSFLYNNPSTVRRVWSPVIDSSLHLAGAHWPGRGPSGLPGTLALISRTVSMASSLAAFVKTFQWGHWQVILKRARKHGWQECWRCTKFLSSPRRQGCGGEVWEGKRTFLKCLPGDVSAALTSLSLFLSSRTAFISCSRAEATTMQSALHK